MTRRTRRMVGILIAAGVAASTGVGAAMPVAASGSPPAAHVRIPGTVHEGQRGVILVDLSVRCASGYVPQELLLGIEQGEFAPYEGPSNVDGIVCDGRSHTVRVAGPEGFDDGPARLSVRLTVVDATTGDPAPQAVDERAVWVRSASDIRAARVATIRPDGSVAVRVTARCDSPWIASQVSASVTRQPVFGGFGYLPDGVFPCDFEWHTVTVIVAPEFGAFAPGRARVEVTINLLDAEQFDPVDQTMRSSRIRLVRA